jgi:hypothetical protein
MDEVRGNEVNDTGMERKSRRQAQCALMMDWWMRTGGSSRTREMTGDSSAGHHI